MKDINLLQGFKDEKKPFDLKENTRRAGIIIGGVTLVLLLIYIGTLLTNAHYKAKTADLQEEAAGYVQVQEVKNASIQKTAAINNIRHLLTVASATSYLETSFLKNVSSVLNANTFLTNLTVNENGTVSIVGKSATRKEIANFLYSLKKTKLFTDVSTNVVNTETPSEGGASTYDFTFTAVIKGGEAGE